jgi:ribosomal protein S18 acetylase RimI-like enzyme
MDHFQRPDLAVLWDIRVHPDYRRQGIAAQLFSSAVAWAQAKGCDQLGLETQNVNVPACRFYASQGCQLAAIHRYGYAGCPGVAHEALLLWYLDL